MNQTDKQTLLREIVMLYNLYEFMVRDVKRSLTQREVGVDTDSFAVGLQAALRQDPDVIVIGEMRDGETLDTAIKAVEMGHLVISALPTPDVTSTVGRLHSMFPADAREIGRMRLAESMRAIISQRLLPRRDEKGRVAAFEVLLGSAATRACIQDPERLETLKEKIGKAREPVGMQTFEQHLEELLQAGVISAETVIAASGGEPGTRKRK